MVGVMTAAGDSYYLNSSGNGNGKPLYRNGNTGAAVGTGQQETAGASVGTPEARDSLGAKLGCNNGGGPWRDGVTRE